MDQLAITIQKLTQQKLTDNQYKRFWYLIDILGTAKWMTGHSEFTKLIINDLESELDGFVKDMLTTKIRNPELAHNAKQDPRRFRIRTVKTKKGIGRKSRPNNNRVIKERGQ